ncbi:unnamed protein product [Adineta ricciae]|uniref:Uncharacterized protein n=1 Tax=Adineta ricciae TaxID=249248 RepID=A0A815H843_ADIRI|nr:unnamed protein product [Adineta ricciae]
MPDFGPCGDPTCSQTAVRLFDCAHHCMKMVCLQHLIEHDRVFERNKKQLENEQSELKRLHSVYSSLIDENKIRSEYEHKLDEYKKLVNEVNSLLSNRSTDVDKYRSIVDKLKKMINEKQKQFGESLTIVKVEPSEENLSLTTTKDESIYIGFDRLENLVIDTDYHKRKARELAMKKRKPENKLTITNDDDDDNDSDIPNLPVHRIPGICPLWIQGAYGLNTKHHAVRLCRKKHFNDLSNHIRQFHGLLTPVANLIARAVDSQISTMKCLIPNDLQVADSRRSFLCPFRSECSTQYWLPGICLKSHLVDVHHMTELAADLKIQTIRKLNRNKPMLKIRSKIYKIMKQIDGMNMPQRGQCTDLTCTEGITELYECHCCNWLICLKHLLEHVNVAQNDRRKQIEHLRNDLVSVTHTLQQLVEKKIMEIEREKKLIIQARTKIDSTGCSIEDLKAIFDEIHQAIFLNGREELVVKTEPSIDILRVNACNEWNVVVSETSSLPKSTFSERSPTYVTRRTHKSSEIMPNISTDDNHLMDTDLELASSTYGETTVSNIEDTVDDENHDPKNEINAHHIVAPCPLRSHGAFGLTKARHGIKFCTSRIKTRQHLYTHFQTKHCLKSIYADRLCRAVADGLQPKTTNLFADDEEVTDRDRYIPCPFTNGKINLIGCCPPYSRRIPCKNEAVPGADLKHHLVNVHHISAAMAREIDKIYKYKLSQNNNQISN